MMTEAEIETVTADEILNRGKHLAAGYVPGTEDFCEIWAYRGTCFILTVVDCLPAKVYPMGRYCG